MAELQPSGPLTIEEIMDCIPHRYPFLLVDRILEREGHERVVGIKQLTVNEEFFWGHFPGAPEMPPTLMLECMAQVGAAALTVSRPGKGRYILFASVDNCTFGRPAVPGDRLEVRAWPLNFRGDMGRMRVVCRVGEEELASADLTFALADDVG